MSTITSALSSSTYSAVVPTVNQSGAFATTAATLANDSSVIASISGASSSAPLYTAQGLMDSLVQAASDSGTSASSSTGTGTTTTTSTAFNGTPDWATVLKSDPGLTSTFLTDSSNQLIVNSLSVYA